MQPRVVSRTCFRIETQNTTAATVVHARAGRRFNRQNTRRRDTLLGAIKNLRRPVFGTYYLASAAGDVFRIFVEEK